MTHQAYSENEFSAALEAGDVERMLELLEGEIGWAGGAERQRQLRLTQGRLLAATGDLRAALPAFDEALILSGTPEQRASVLLARAEAQEAAGVIDLARDDLDVAMEALSDPAERALGLQILGRLERDHGDLASGVAMLVEARDSLLTFAIGGSQLSEATLDLSMALRLAGDTDASIALLEQLASSAEPAMAARLLVHIGATRAFAGQAKEALDAWWRALPLLEGSVERAIVRYNRAVALREVGDHDAAGDELARALVENAGQDARVEFDALLLAGIVARETGDLQRSLDFLTEATLRAPDQDQEGRARLEVGATLAETGLFGPAEVEFSAAMSLCDDPSDRARALRHRGKARQELGQIDGALADFTAAIELTDDPDERARGQLTLAPLLLQSGRRREALVALDRAVQGARDSGLARQALALRGATHAQTGDLEAAIVDFEQVAEQAARASDRELQARALIDLGAIHAAVNANDRALDMYRAAAGLDADGPTTSMALTQLANLLVSLGEPSALDVFEQTAVASRDDRDARAATFLARAAAALRWERYDEAEADCERAIALRPSRPLEEKALAALRTTRSHIEHVGATRERLTRTIAAMDRPEYRARPTLERGLLALTVGDHQAALVDLTRATQSFRSRHERALAHACLALAHARLGKCVEAIGQLRNADSLDPQRTWLREIGGNIHWRACAETSRIPAFELKPAKQADDHTDPR